MTRPARRARGFVTVKAAIYFILSPLRCRRESPPGQAWNAWPPGVDYWLRRAYTRSVKRLTSLTIAVAIACLTGVAAQPSPLITEVRAAIKANDCPLAGKAIADYRARSGVTAEMLEALSWMGRGALAAKDLDAADKYARE